MYSFDKRAQVEQKVQKCASFLNCYFHNTTHNKVLLCIISFIIHQYFRSRVIGLNASHGRITGEYSPIFKTDGQ